MVVLHGHICGCYYTTPAVNTWSVPQRHYLPQVNVKAHTTILSTTSRTALSQKFVVPSKSHGVRKLQYAFPLFDGVSVVGFKCTVGDRVIIGEVQEKEQAKKTYDDAVERGETAGLLEQLPQASDVFVTTIGNVPPDATVLVDIVYLGELKHDAEVDGVRFTIPTTIAPRYGDYPGQISSLSNDTAEGGKFEVTIDIDLANDFAIREVRSPTHPIAVSLGSIHSDLDSKPSMNRASVSLSLGTAQLFKDFVLQIVSKDFGTPSAVLESHPRIPGSRALMATLVPKFQPAQQRPEIVFICDRSGSMTGDKIIALRNALQVFLKSLPLGVVFNICSFGSSHSFLWPKSKTYNKENMEEAVQHVKTFGADYGGTEMLEPIKATMNRRFSDRALEVFLVTDGEIWDQQTLFDLLNQRVRERKEPVRVFTLGVGDDVSHALIEGVARAGDGFSQTVGEQEKLDAKVVRMLKGALIPHVQDYRLELKYEKDDEDDFELVEKVAYIYDNDVALPDRSKSKAVEKVISLFDRTVDANAPDDEVEIIIPKVKMPHSLQAPQRIPQLYPFNRTSVYVLLSQDSPQKTLRSITLRGTTEQGSLELEIPVSHLAEPGETIHQLAAKKAVLELEEGRGWLQEAKTKDGELVKEIHTSHFDEIVRLETVRLGTTFQVGGKNCSFVAVEKSPQDASSREPQYVYLDDAEPDSRIPAGVPKQAPSIFQPFGGSVASPFTQSLSNSSFGGAPSAPAPSGLAPFTQASSSYGAPPSAAFSSPISRVRAPAPKSQTGGLFGNSSSFQGGFGGGAGGGIFASAASSSFAASNQQSMFGGAVPPPPPPPPPASAEPAAFGAPSMFDMSSMSAAPQQDMMVDACADVIDYSEEDEDEEQGQEKGGIDSAQQVNVRAPVSDPLQALVELQTFEGYWEQNNNVFRVLNIDEAAIKQRQVAEEDKSVLITVLVVYFLETELAKDKDSWELIVEKARAWLEGKVSSRRLKELFGMARSLFTENE